MAHYGCQGLNEGLIRATIGTSSRKLSEIIRKARGMRNATLFLVAAAIEDTKAASFVSNNTDL